MTREIPITSNNTLRFLLRGLFGLGSRAECLVYLLTHDGGHPSEVSKNIGLSVRGTQDALIELSKSGLILTRVKGKRKIEYWLSQDRWWEFLSRASIAKVYAGDVAVMVTNKAMELMGSYGYVRDYDVEKYWRDCKIIQVWEGGGQLGRFDVCRGYYDCNL